MNSPIKNASEFSAHLFWDVDSNTVDLLKHRKWLIKRVLEKGTREDWNKVLKHYGKDGVREAVRGMRSLEKKALSFTCVVLELDQSELQCSINRSFHATHWNY